MILNVNVTIVVKCVGWRGVGGGGEGGDGRRYVKVQARSIVGILSESIPVKLLKVWKIVCFLLAENNQQ